MAAVPILRQNAGITLVILKIVQVQLLLLKVSNQSSCHSAHIRRSNLTTMNSRNSQTMQRISLLGSGGPIRMRRFPRGGCLLRCETFFEDYWSESINKSVYMIIFLWGDDLCLLVRHLCSMRVFVEEQVSKNMFFRLMSNTIDMRQINRYHERLAIILEKFEVGLQSQF